MRGNDRHVAPRTDDALRKVSAVLAHETRSGDRAYRYGGEEFLLVLAGQTLAQAMIATERIRSAVEALAIPHRTSRADDVVTISAGVSAWDYEQLDTPTSVLDRADTALYRSKANGRNRVTGGEPNPSSPSVTARHEE